MSEAPLQGTHRELGEQREREERGNHPPPERYGILGVWDIQGYLAHKKLPPPRTLQ